MGGIFVSHFCKKTKKLQILYSIKYSSIYLIFVFKKMICWIINRCLSQQEKNNNEDDKILKNVPIGNYLDINYVYDIGWYFEKGAH